VSETWGCDERQLPAAAEVRGLEGGGNARIMLIAFYFQEALGDDRDVLSRFKINCLCVLYVWFGFLLFCPR
jgi:hypothetical protein